MSHPAARFLFVSALIGCAVARGAPVAVKQLDAITATAPRITDPRVLDRVVIPGFVRSHAVAGSRFNQVARWGSVVCVKTEGLDPEYDQSVSERVAKIARSVGLRTGSDGHCRPNIEILFESSPQRALDYIAKNNDDLLGLHSRPQLKELATFNRLIEAWYVTASVDDDGFATTDTSGATLNSSDQGLSLLSSGFSSQFVNVLVIVDAVKTGDLPLKTVADYIALIALTRTEGSDTCSDLASILDFLSAACGDRAKPSAITSADLAFLKALYSTDLRLQLNLELGEIHDRMLRNILDN